MSARAPRRTTQAQRRRPRPRLTGRLLAALAAAVAFALGIALGQALGDNPAPGGTTTSIRTLRPLPLGGAPATVTVTVPEGGDRAED